MTAIPFPISSAPGDNVQEGAGRLVNCFAEKAEAGSRFPVVWRRSPGLRELIDLVSHVHLRGAILVGSTLIVVMNTRVYTITLSGSTYTATNRGALAGTGSVTVAMNNATVPDIVCVATAEVACFNLFAASAPTAFADIDLTSPNSVSSLNGYFLWTHGSGKITASDLNSVNVASNSNAVFQGRPGGLLRGVAYRGEFFAFGPSAIGVYKDAGLSPFPLEFVTMIPRGITGTHAVAGWEPGWSNELIWVGDDNRVYKLNGYTPEPISNADVSRAIERSDDTSLLEASVYMRSGHAFWTLTNPGEWTWEYNLTTGNWNERESFNAPDWRGSSSVFAFDQWVVGDRETGKLFKADDTYYREGSDPLIFTLESGLALNFPGRVAIPRADFDVTSAVGDEGGEDPIETDPTVLISWALDGGYSFGNPVARPLGAEGAGESRVTIHRLGSTNGRGVRFRLKVSDPVHVAVMGAQMAELQKAA